MGSGAFGRVVQAQLIGLKKSEPATTVAVKMTRSTVANLSAIETLISELKIMIHLGKDLNIVNLIGACTINAFKGWFMQ